MGEKRESRELFFIYLIFLGSTVWGFLYGQHKTIEHDRPLSAAAAARTVTSEQTTPSANPMATPSPKPTPTPTPTPSATATPSPTPTPVIVPSANPVAAIQVMPEIFEKAGFGI